jgi:hypothetical protein
MDSTTKHQLIQLGIMVLPPVIAWVTLDFPTSTPALAVLVAAELGAVLSFLQGFNVVSAVKKSLGM